MDGDVQIRVSLDTRDAERGATRVQNAMGGLKNTLLKMFAPRALAANLQKQLKDLETSITEAQSKYNDLLQTKADKASAVDTLKTQLEDVQKEIEKTQKDLDRLNGFGEKTGKLYERANILNGAIEESQNGIMGETENIAMRKGKIKENQAKLDAANKSKDSEAARLAEENIAFHTQKLMEAQQQLAAFKEYLKNDTKELEQIYAQIDAENAFVGGSGNGTLDDS